MDIKNILRTYQSIAISIAVLLFCITALIGGVIPSVQKVKELFISVSSLSKDNAMLKDKTELLDSYTEEDLKQKLAVVLSAVSGDKGLPSLFSTVEAVAETAGVRMVDMTVTGGIVASSSAGKQSASEKKVGSHIVPFTVTVTGTEVSIQQFIMLAPAVRRLMRIRLFSIIFSKSDQELTVTLSMDAFYEPYVSQLGGTSSVLTPLSESELAFIDTLSTFPLVGQATQAAPATAVTEQKLNPFSR